MLLKSLRYSKSSGYKVLQEFFTFLRYRFKVDASINDYIQEPKREGIDRLLDILKVLQGSGMRRCDLCERYNIEDDTLRSDDSSVSIPLEDINSIEEVAQKRAASGPPAIRRAGNRDMI